MVCLQKLMTSFSSTVFNFQTIWDNLSRRLLQTTGDIALGYSCSIVHLPSSQSYFWTTEFFRKSVYIPPHWIPICQIEFKEIRDIPAIFNACLISVVKILNHYSAYLTDIYRQQNGLNPNGCKDKT